MNVVYDTGVLLAAARDNRRVWADHQARLEIGLLPVVPAPVVAQASRSNRQVPLRRFLRGCDTVAFAPQQAHRVGGLLAVARSSDVVDAHVVLVASERDAMVVTSDPKDLEHLSACLDRPVDIERL